MSDGKFLAILGVLVLIAANTLPENSPDTLAPVMYGWTIGILICAIISAIMD